MLVAVMLDAATPTPFGERRGASRVGADRVARDRGSVIAERKFPSPYFRRPSLFAIVPPAKPGQ